MEREACNCSWLSRAADSDLFPIVFDEVTNEYHLLLRGDEEPRGYAVLRFCPFCGGSAPASKRGSLFTEISREEFGRLVSLVRGLTTIDETIARLGEPDSVLPADEENYQVRELIYESLSPTAMVRCYETHNGCVNIQFEAKYIGPGGSGGPGSSRGAATEE